MANNIGVHCKYL